MNDRAVYAALLRRDFTFFLRHAFDVIGGEGAYNHNWHIDAIAHELDLARRGENSHTGPQRKTLHQEAGQMAASDYVPNSSKYRLHL